MPTPESKLRIIPTIRSSGAEENVDKIKAHTEEESIRHAKLALDLFSVIVGTFLEDDEVIEVSMDGKTYLVHMLDGRLEISEALEMIH